MNVSSIQTTSPSFNGVITIQNTKTKALKYYYTNNRTDKALLESFGKLYNIFPLMDTFFKESMKQEKVNRLAQYLKTVFDETHDNVVKDFMDSFKEGKSNILQLAAEYRASSPNDHFSKLSIDDFVVTHTADFKHKNIE